ncbi:hypothetical protein SAMN05421759_102348 [Roseivivax lentus]|uniref:Uncharacterized protein n=1 Tax=Roseivivax lentus TaxID=633194 RepID=A0A1N7L3R1_9RHOB|nr:hypothetical protein [Roseivivax lentus]SIS68431.1 hypothetical protein SAMN05421759_102348 [Roseivivax lentus]
MSLITPETRASALEEERQEFLETLKELRAALNDLKTKVRAEQMTREDKAEAKRLLEEARYWLRQVRETEAELVKIEREKAGIQGSWGLDLEKSRAEIQCRLARLPKCGCTGGLVD